MEKKNVDKIKGDNVISEKRKIDKAKIYKLGLIVLLVILVSVLSFITISDEFRDMSEDEEIVDEMGNEKVDGNDEQDNSFDNIYEVEVPEKFKEADDLLEKFGFYDSLGGGSQCFLEGSAYENYDDQFKIKVVLSNLDENKIQTKSCAELYSDFTPNSQYFVNDGNESIGVCLGDAKVIAYEDANAVFKEMYGYEMPKSNVNLTVDRYDYDEKSNLFIELSCECGGMCGIMPNHVIKSVKYDDYHDNSNDTMVIEIYGVYYVYDNDNNDVLFHDVVLDDELNLFEQVKEKDLLQYAPVYEIGFVKRDGKYIFDYLEKK